MLEIDMNEVSTSSCKSNKTFTASAVRARESFEQDNVRGILRAARLRPTRQRVALSSLLFGKGSRHVTAEMLSTEAASAKVKVSHATVYNTLNQLTEAGLLRRIGVERTKTYFDTNVTAHYHFYLENRHELIDIHNSDLQFRVAPHPPEGYEISRTDVVVRLRASG